MINFLEQFFNSITQLKSTNSSTNLLNKRSSKQKRFVLILETSRLKKQIKVTTLLLMTKILHSIHQLGRTITNFFLFDRRQLFNTRSLSTIQTSTGTQIILLGIFGLSLRLDKTDLSFFLSNDKLTSLLNSNTISVILSSLRKILLILRPNLSNLSFTLSQISNCLSLSKTSLNLKHNILKLLGKQIGFSGCLNVLEQRILILNTNSFGQSFHSSGIRQLSLSTNVLNLNGLHSGFTKRRSTLLNSTPRIFHIRRRGNRTNISGIGSTRINAHRLKGRTLDKGVNSSSLITGTLSGRRLDIIVRPFGKITIFLPLSTSIFPSIFNLPFVHLFLPFLSLTHPRPSGKTGKEGAGSIHNRANPHSGCSKRHNYSGLACLKRSSCFFRIRSETTEERASIFSKRSAPGSKVGSTSSEPSSS